VLSHDGDKVKVNLPLPFIKALIASGANIDIGNGMVDNVNIDWNNIINMVEHGVIGKIVEVESANGDTVEIVVE
jgi:hypothetical protein